MAQCAARCLLASLLCFDHRCFPRAECTLAAAPAYINPRKSSQVSKGADGGGVVVSCRRARDDDRPTPRQALCAHHPSSLRCLTPCGRCAHHVTNCSRRARPSRHATFAASFCCCQERHRDGLPSSTSLQRIAAVFGGCSPHTRLSLCPLRCGWRRRCGSTPRNCFTHHLNTLASVGMPCLGAAVAATAWHASRCSWR